MKTCSGCGETKPLEDFPRRSQKHARDGRYSYCVPCNRLLTRERMRKWRAANPKRERVNRQRSAALLRERHPNYFRDWYHRNAESERARSREVMRRFRSQHPDRVREQKLRYRAAHLEEVRQRERENTQRRRAQMTASSPGTATYMALLLREPCAYCGSTENITIDHVVPLSRGGKHEPANLAPACVTCNCSKGAKSVEEWLTPSLW